jgi:hypothetical protein
MQENAEKNSLPPASPSFDWFFLCFYKNSEEKQTKTKKSHKKQDFRMRG